MDQPNERRLNGRQQLLHFTFPSSFHYSCNRTEELHAPHRAVMSESTMCDQIIANNLQVVCPYHLCGVQTRLTFFQLKDSLTAHFANIRVAGSFLGRDHANILQRHIRTLLASMRRRRKVIFLKQFLTWRHKQRSIRPWN